MPVSVGASIVWVAPRKPKAILLRRFAFLPAISLPSAGWHLLALQSYRLAPTRKPSHGCAAALRPIAIYPWRISILPLVWRCLARWTRRGQQRRRDLRSIRASHFAGYAPTLPAAILPTSLNGSASLRGWASLGCPKCRLSTSDAMVHEGAHMSVPGHFRTLLRV